MKNAFFLLLIAAGFFSCDNKGKQYGEQINQLSADWEALTLSSTELANNLSEATKIWKKTMGELNVLKETYEDNENITFDAEFLGGLKSVESYGNAYKALSSDLTSFMSEWQANSKELMVLKDGLASGNLPADAAEKLAYLQEALDSGKAKLRQWTPQVEVTKTQTEQKYKFLKGWIDKYI